MPNELIAILDELEQQCKYLHDQSHDRQSASISPYPLDAEYGCPFVLCCCPEPEIPDCFGSVPKYGTGYSYDAKYVPG